MNILLTGSGGFIGRNVLERLGDKHSFFAPRRAELDLLNERETDDFFKMHRIDLILHSAACGVRITPEATNENIALPNIKMFENLLSHVSKNCRMITFGSGAEYDKSRALCRVRETDFGKRIPQDPYGYSKYMISKEIEKRQNVLNLRIFGIYGKYEHPSRFTSFAVSKNLNRQPVVCRRNAVFHFLYIDDFCRILDFFIQNPVDEKAINVCPTESIDLKTLAETVNAVSDFKSELLFEKDGMNPEYTGDNSLLLKYLPDFKFTSYTDGLRAFMRFMKG